MTKLFTLEEKKEFLQMKLSDYIEKFEEKGLNFEGDSYSKLKTSIDFSFCESSVYKVDKLFKIRYKIEKYINECDFNKEYKKLNKIFLYNIDKYIKDIYQIDLKIDINSNKIFRVYVFDNKDLELYCQNNFE